MDPAREGIAEGDGKNISQLSSRVCLVSEGLKHMGGISTPRPGIFSPKLTRGCKRTVSNGRKALFETKRRFFLRSHSCSFQRGPSTGLPTMKMVFLANKPLLCIHAVELAHISGTHCPIFWPP